MTITVGRHNKYKLTIRDMTTEQRTRIDRILDKERLTVVSNDKRIIILGLSDLLDLSYFEGKLCAV